MKMNPVVAQLLCFGNQVLDPPFFFVPRPQAYMCPSIVPVLVKNHTLSLVIPIKKKEIWFLFFDSLLAITNCTSRNLKHYDRELIPITGDANLGTGD